jgi:ribokinase
MTMQVIQLEVPMTIVEKVVALAKNKHCRVILDPAPAQELPVSVIAGVYLLTPNETEAETLTGVPVDDINSARIAAKKLLSAGAKNVAITLGGQGVFLATQENDQLISTPKVDAIDTTAAGDCFNGSLAAALSAGGSLAESMAFACRVAAVSVTRLGAQDSMPYAHEVDFS